MKTRLTFTLIMIIGFLFTSCKSKVDLVNDEFPEEKEEVINTFVAIAQSIKDGDIDKLSLFMPIVRSLLNSRMESLAMVVRQMKLMNAMYLVL